MLPKHTTDAAEEVTPQEKPSPATMAKKTTSGGVVAPFALSPQHVVVVDDKEHVCRAPAAITSWPEVEATGVLACPTALDPQQRALPDDVRVQT